MQVLVCTVDTSPCPPESIASVPLTDAFDPVALGITPDSVLSVFSWGLGAVLFFFALGVAVGAARGVIRRL